eukprot:1484429-Amphidinium_carterae.1
MSRNQKLFFVLALVMGFILGRVTGSEEMHFGSKGQLESDQSVQVIPPGTQAWVEKRIRIMQSMSRSSLWFNRQSESRWSVQSMSMPPGRNPSVGTLVKINGSVSAIIILCTPGELAGCPLNH